MSSSGAFESRQYFKAYDTLIGECLPHKHLLETVLKELDIKRKDKVLDIGCGTGHFLKMLKEMKVEEITGIDNSKFALEFCKQKVPEANLLKLNIRKSLPFQSNTFDKIAAINVLYLIPKQERKKILKELYRVLKNGGKIAVVNPKKGGRDIKIFLEDIKETIKRDGFLKGGLRFLKSFKAFSLMLFPYKKKVSPKKFFLPKEQEEILRSCGFKILKTNFIYANQAILTIGKK